MSTTSSRPWPRPASDAGPIRPTKAPAAYVRVPCRSSQAKPSTDQLAVSVSHAKMRAQRQSHGLLKTWRLIGQVQCSTTCITAVIQAVLTLYFSASD